MEMQFIHFSSIFLCGPVLQILPHSFLLSEIKINKYFYLLLFVLNLKELFVVGLAIKLSIQSSIIPSS